MGRQYRYSQSGNDDALPVLYGTGSVVLASECADHGLSCESGSQPGLV